jgi:hypothetical protein
MLAVRVLAVTAAAVVAAGCAGGSRGPAFPGPSGGPFAPLSWTSRAAPPARQTTVMAYYPPGREIVLFGGVTPYRHGFERALNDTWVFNEHGWRRLHPRHSPHPRDGELLAYDPATRLLLLFGGYSQRGKQSKVFFDSWAWNGSDWRRRPSVRLPTWMPGEPVAAYDPVARRITALAPMPGYRGSFPRKETFNGNGKPMARWLWTGRSWTYHAEDPAPPMDGGVLAPDPLSGGMLYFTYTPDTVDDPPAPDPTGTLDSETWLWHDGHFTKQTPSRAPLPGDPVLMAGDPRIGRVVMVSAAGRLWAWTGTTWQALASGPGPRAGAATAYDPALGALVVFGTVARSGTSTRQTWLWNGTAWNIGP